MSDDDHGDDAAQIQHLTRQIYELTGRLHALQRTAPPQPVDNYEFQTLQGPVTLIDLFGEARQLLVIHNMGQACRYCTLWADGFNGYLPHLEDAMGVVLVSKDTPEQQRRFASARGWRLRMASHGGGRYITEQSVVAGEDNMPGAVLYERAGTRVLRRNASVFGPGDSFCAAWSLLALAGLGPDNWTPQFSYWQRPEQLDDGGLNLLA